MGSDESGDDDFFDCLDQFQEQTYLSSSNKLLPDVQYVD